jgi:hypothetical protein
VFEWTHQTLAGREFPCEVTLVRLPDSERTLIRGSIIDITRRKLLEEQLRQSQKMEAVGRLAGGVAHDFNNLLTVITLSSHMLLDMLKPVTPAELVKDISDAAERASGLTRQLLTFGRKDVLAPKVLDINAAVREAESMLRRLIGEDVLLVVELDPHAWPVTIDPGHLGQVLMNLSVNARDAMPRGGTLVIRTANVEDQVCLRVFGFRHRHAAGGAGAGVRAVLHVEGRRQGHRARARRRARHRRSERRAHRGGERAGAGHDVLDLPSEEQPWWITAPADVMTQPRATATSRSCCGRRGEPAPSGGSGLAGTRVHGAPGGRRCRGDPGSRGSS